MPIRSTRKKQVRAIRRAPGKQPARARLRPLKPLASRRASLIRPEEISPVDVQTRVLDNGLRLISERVLGSGSVGIALYVDVGSRYEKKEESGIAHFIEHLVFKGTEGRSMREIMRSVESRGGMLNAFTTKEHTCYYAWTRTMYLSEAMGILHELAFRPTFDAREIERERAVIIEEIHGIEDEADESLFDAFEEVLFAGHPLAKPVIGKEKTIAKLNRAALGNFHKSFYTPQRVSLVASGAHQHADFFAYAADLFTKERRKPAQRRSSHSIRYNVGQKQEIVCKAVSQTHVVIGVPAPSFVSSDLPAVQAIVTALGVGMSSRLSLRLREELALAYDTMAFYTPYSDAGCIGVYAAMTEDEAERGRDEMQKLIRNLIRKPISQVELDRVKDQIIGGLVLSMESVATRLMRTGQFEMYHRRYLPIEEEIDRIATLTLSQIRAKTEEYFGDEKRLTVVSTRSK